MNTSGSVPRLTLAFIETVDGASLRNFYGELLNLPLRKEFGTSWVEYGSDAGHRLAVHQPSDLVPDDEARLYLSFEVERLDDLHARLRTSGIDCSDIRNPDRGRFFTCLDPAGNRLHFIEFTKQWREETAY
jgi:predicted enzyme related to lactoylglutathione lyase